MRPDVIEGMAEFVEVALLGTEVGLRRPSSFALEGSVHAFVTAILLRLTRPRWSQDGCRAGSTKR